MDAGCLNSRISQATSRTSSEKRSTMHLNRSCMSMRSSTRPWIISQSISHRSCTTLKPYLAKMCQRWATMKQMQMFTKMTIPSIPSLARSIIIILVLRIRIRICFQISSHKSTDISNLWVLKRWRDLIKWKIWLLSALIQLWGNLRAYLRSRARGHQWMHRQFIKTCYHHIWRVRKVAPSQSFRS